MEHIVYGAGRQWELAVLSRKPTRITLFPDRRFASVRYTDATTQPRYVDLIPDYLAACTTDAHRGALALVTTQEDRVTLLTIHSTGEVDDHFRFAGNGLTPETPIYDAALNAPMVSQPVSERLPIPVAKAGEQLGFHPTHVKKLIRAGELAGYKLGRNWYVDSSSLEDFSCSRGRRKRQHLLG